MVLIFGVILQDSVVQLLKIALIDRLDKESCVALEPYSVDALEVLSPIVQYGTDIVELGDLSKCTLEGSNLFCSLIHIHLFTFRCKSL